MGGSRIKSAVFVTGTDVVIDDELAVYVKSGSIRNPVVGAIILGSV